MSETKRRTIEGRVVGGGRDKTVIVISERAFRHPLYQKVMRKTKKYKAHDELGSAKLGDIVRIMEGRPLSKDKHFRVIEVIGKSKERA